MISHSEDYRLLRERVDAAACRMFDVVSCAFPICSASDEFPYFPQVVRPEPQWSVWDDFSPEAVEEVAGTLSAAEEEFSRPSKGQSDPETLTDISLLTGAARTLREQLTEVRFHLRQPTFYVTVANIGLSEALSSSDPDAWCERVRGLPAFLEAAGRTLRRGRVPALFRDLGVEMVRKSLPWASTLKDSGAGIPQPAEAIDRFGELLRDIPTGNDFILPREVMERVVRDHLGCDGGVDEIYRELELETAEAERSLEREARRLDPGLPWAELWENIPRRGLPPGGVTALYRNEVAALERHCTDLGLISPELARACPVEVVPVPAGLWAIRGTDAYSARPGHPPSGGTFYLLAGGRVEVSGGGLHPGYRMTAAHETYPGHHLLDVSRWNLRRAIRRPLERPLFYEGWACFAEELLSRTGYFSGDWDRLILARRRLRHAVRGKADLGLQSGWMDISAASRDLARVGFSRLEAHAAARRYTLQPGYQVCYTIGRRRLQSLCDRFGAGDEVGFARRILAEGEIAFKDLERALALRCARSHLSPPSP